MNPDSEFSPNDQPKPSQPQSETPFPSSNPGGIIKPTNSEAQAPSPIESPVPTQPVTPQTFQPQQTASDSGFSSKPIVPGTNQPSQTPNLNTPAASSGQMFQPDSFGEPPKARRFKFLNKKFAIIAAPILLVLLISGYVFGYYIPNKPENVYKTGLNRTGTALEALLDKATDRQTYDKYKKSELKATVDINAAGQNIKGDFTAKFDEKKLDSSLNINFPVEGSEPVNLGFKLLSEQADNKEFPDTYFSFKGINSLGGDMFLPGISKYDDRWISVTADYLKSLADDYGLEIPEQENNNDKYPTFEEISSLAKDSLRITNEYLFTSDPEKAVLNNKAYLGKEDVEGVSSFRYEVNINKANFKAYCEAVSNNLLANPTYKKLSGQDDQAIEEEKKKIGEDCQKGSDEIKEEDTFEMWVDSKYKLIKKIRVYSEDNKGEYFEIGQNYNGGDKVGLFVASASDRDGFNSKFTLTTDLKTGESSGELTFNGGTENGKYDGKVTLTASPLTGDLTITKPENAISIQKFFKDFGIDPEALFDVYGGSQSKAVDSDTKSQINSVYSQLEVHYAENSSYPTEAQLNDESWRQANVFNLYDIDISKFTYAPTDCDATGCQKFTLSAELSNGEKFTKTSLNN